MTQLLNRPRTRLAVLATTALLVAGGSAAALAQPASADRVARRPRGPGGVRRRPPLPARRARRRPAGRPAGRRPAPRPAPRTPPRPSTTAGTARTSSRVTTTAATAGTAPTTEAGTARGRCGTRGPAPPSACVRAVPRSSAAAGRPSRRGCRRRPGRRVGGAALRAASRATTSAAPAPRGGGRPVRLGHLGEQLLAPHLDVPGGVDPDPDDVAALLEDGDDDVVTDDEALADPSAQHQHAVTPVGSTAGGDPTPRAQPMRARRPRPTTGGRAWADRGPPGGTGRRAGCGG